MTKGKTLKKQEASFTDETGTMRLVLSEDDIQKVTSSHSYELSQVMIRSFQDQKYLTLNRNSTIKPTDNVIKRNDTVSADRNLNKVSCPAEGVKSFQPFLSCNNCKTKVVAVANKNIIHCSECGLTQLKNRCTTRLYANVMFSFEQTSTVSLVLFDDKLQSLYQLFIQQNPHFTKEFSSLDYDELMEIILTVQATVIYNKTKNVIAIKKKDD